LLLNIRPRRRNARVNIKGHIKKNIFAIPKYVLPDVSVVFKLKRAFLRLGFRPNEAIVGEDICSANHNLWQDVQGKRIVKTFSLMDTKVKYLISHI